MLIYIPFIWNYLIIKMANGKYKNFPQISGFLKIWGSRGKITFGKNVVINSSVWSNSVGNRNSCFFNVSDGAEIVIGSNVGISNSLLYALNSITIEDNVMIGGGCQILDNDFHSLNYSIRKKETDYDDVKHGPILVKKGAFIGTSSIILKNVIIGEQSIVAAGSVVTKSIPDGEIWGGNPARFIRKITTSS